MITYAFYCGLKNFETSGKKNVSITFFKNYLLFGDSGLQTFIILVMAPGCFLVIYRQLALSTKFCQKHSELNIMRLHT